jgi:hypothetical protein
MSVYKPAKSRFYQYDFQYKGKRYTGSTGVATMRKAEEVERKVRADVALGLYDDQAGMTLDEAAGQWWEEVGRHLRTARDVERRLEILLAADGAANPPRRHHHAQGVCGDREAPERNLPEGARPAR